MSPFRSKRQMRFMFAAEARGDIPKGTARRWAHKTKSIKKLPERKRTYKRGSGVLMGDATLRKVGAL